MSVTRKCGLLPPPVGWAGSSHPPLLGAPDIKLLTWPELIDIAKSGKRDGRVRFGYGFTRNQLHSNCNGASVSALVQKLIFVATGKNIPLSDTYIYSLINGGRDNGSMLFEAMAAIVKYGVCEASFCGPNAIFRSQYNTREADKNAARFKALEPFAIRPRDFNGDKDALERAIWSAVALGFPVQVAVQAGNNFDRVDSSGLAGVDNGPANHAVHLDGLVWHDGIKKVVGTGDNTWPESWGQRGRMLLQWKHFEQCVGVHEFFAVRGVEIDPMSNRPSVK